MKNTAAMIVTAMIVVGAFAGSASAASPYVLMPGESANYFVAGFDAELIEHSGQAEMTSRPQIQPGILHVTVKCLDSSSEDCVGLVVTKV